MEKILRDLIEAEPNITQAQAAVRLGVSRQRISKLCQELGIKMPDGRRGRPLGLPKRSAELNHFGHERQRHNPAFIGGACELVVAADLLKRGIPTYRSLTPSAAFDLVADYEGQLFRIEVRAAKKKDEQVVFSRPEKRYDVLALVTPDAQVIYRPIEECAWPF